MNPSRAFILRPVTTALLMAAIVIVGSAAFLKLPISALPEVEYPTVQVRTFYPGASPDVKIAMSFVFGLPTRSDAEPWNTCGAA